MNESINIAGSPYYVHEVKKKKQQQKQVDGP